MNKQSFIARVKSRREEMGKRPLARKPKRIAPPPDFAYQQKLVALVRQVRELINQELIPMLPHILDQAEEMAAPRHDAVTPSRTISTSMGKIQLQATTLVMRTAPQIAEAQAKDTAARNKSGIEDQMQSVLGVQPFMQEPWLGDQLNSFALTNADLIQSTIGKSINQVATLVQNATLGGYTAKQISSSIADILDTTESHARFIARDQIAKLNSQLTQVRQNQLGVKKYIWRTSLDERVRTSHRRLEGKTERWDKPPLVAPGRRCHPGMDFNCRCTAEPVFD